MTASSRAVATGDQPSRSAAIFGASRTFWSSRRIVSSAETSSVLTSMTSNVRETG